MTEELSLAESFEDLKSSAAFRVLLKQLRADVEQAKGIAVTALASDDDRTVRNLVISWQEREKVLIGIEYLIDQQAEIKIRIEQELEDERNAERDRRTRTNW